MQSNIIYFSDYNYQFDMYDNCEKECEIGCNFGITWCYVKTWVLGGNYILIKKLKKITYCKYCILKFIWKLWYFFRIWVEFIISSWQGQQHLHNYRVCINPKIKRRKKKPMYTLHNVVNNH